MNLDQVKNAAIAIPTEREKEQRVSELFDRSRIILREFDDICAVIEKAGIWRKFEQRQIVLGNIAIDGVPGVLAASIWPYDRRRRSSPNITTTIHHITDGQGSRPSERRIVMEENYSLPSMYRHERHYLDDDALFEQHSQSATRTEETLAMLKEAMANPELNPQFAEFLQPQEA